MLTPRYCPQCRHMIFSSEGQGKIQYTCRFCRQGLYLTQDNLYQKAPSNEFYEDAVEVLCKKCHRHLLWMEGDIQWSTKCSFCRSTEQIVVPDGLSPEKREQYIASQQHRQRPIKRLVSMSDMR